MELYSAEAKAIQSQVSEWLKNSEFELETTFGPDGLVSQTTFLAVAKRLRAKGYTSLPQEDRLTITTRDNVRFTLSSLGIIQEYCRDDLLAGTSFTAMIKDRATPVSNVDLEEYDVRIKSRREIPMGHDDATVKKILEEWPRVQKAFRMIRRWSFEIEGLRFDLSIVRSTKKLPKRNGAANGDYRWQSKFRDQDIMQTKPTYEIEVELLRLEGDTPEKAMKRLVKGAGEVLRGIQKSSILIRKSTVKSVLTAYKEVVGSELFRGPALRPLMKKNFMKEGEQGEGNIRDGYNVTDKADGLRCLGFCNAKGELFMIDMTMRNVYRTGLQNPNCRLSLVDGEWVTTTKDKEATNQFLLFDIFYATDKKDVSQLPFQSQTADKEIEGRYGQLKAWTTTWNKEADLKAVVPGVTAASRIQVSMKDYKFGRAGDDSIFKAAARVLDTARAYYTDGLIFTSNTAPLPRKPFATFFEQFKWKPAKDNTIDFLVKTEKAAGSKFKDKVTVGTHPETGETVTYKTLRLFVGSRNENYRGIILEKQELPDKEEVLRGRGGTYKPTLFLPTDYADAMASVCHLEVQTDNDTGETYVKTEDEEPIQSMTIVEMAYDVKGKPGWRWKPLRLRMDKTERLETGHLDRTLNSERTANDTWNTYYDSITYSMVRTGNEMPSEEEQAGMNQISDEIKIASKHYFDRGKTPADDQILTRSMRDFHNKWIKEQILYRVGLGGGDKKLFDMACGVGSDLQIWRRKKVSFVLGVDYCAENISCKTDSIYKRYVETLAKSGGREQNPDMVFVNADSTKNYVSGEAGTTDPEKNILRAVLGRVNPTAPVGEYVEELKSPLKSGADCMSCIFALHYFLETPEMFNGFLKNVAENLKVGGYFIGCCFDGGRVFELLRDVEKGAPKSGVEKNATIWTITKQYDEDDMPEGEASIGLAIDVNFVTIGETHKEYLVSFPFLVESMKSIGCELLGPADLKEMRLENSTNMFGESWEMAKTAGRHYDMLKGVKDFSFLNRWFIFKRKSQAGPMSVANGNSGLNALKANAEASVRRPNLAQAPPTEEEAEEVAEAPVPVPSLAATRAARAATVAPAAKTKTYVPSELFQFYPKAAEKDILGISDKSAGQWLSPTAPFPIDDYETDTKYPSLNHYIVAMRWKLASTTPEVATTLLGTEGTIHQQFNRVRLLETEGGKKPLPDRRDKDLLELEAAEVRKAFLPSTFKKYKSTFDEAKWATVKDDVLRDGVTQRWENDARFRKIIEAARDKGKTLLYYTPGGNSTNLGGVRRNSGEIEGDNKMGKIMMELAGFD